MFLPTVYPCYCSFTNGNDDDDDDDGGGGCGGGGGGGGGGCGGGGDGNDDGDDDDDDDDDGNGASFSRTWRSRFMSEQLLNDLGELIAPTLITIITSGACLLW